jgi:hypothetical protein
MLFLSCATELSFFFGQGKQLDISIFINPCPALSSGRRSHSRWKQQRPSKRYVVILPEYSMASQPEDLDLNCYFPALTLCQMFGS